MVYVMRWCCVAQGVLGLMFFLCLYVLLRCLPSTTWLMFVSVYMCLFFRQPWRGTMCFSILLTFSHIHVMLPHVCLCSYFSFYSVCGWCRLAKPCRHQERIHVNATMHTPHNLIEYIHAKILVSILEGQGSWGDKIDKVVDH